MTSTPNATLTTEKGLRDTGPIPIDQDVLVFGKSSAVDVNIDNTYVSRRQFQIRCQDDVFFITDLGSTNGTFLNGKRLDPQREQRLRDRDLIGLAEDQVVFRFNDLVKTVSAGLSKRPTSRPPLLMWWVGLAGVGALGLVFATLTFLNPSLTKWSVEATSLARVATPPTDISLATKPTAPTATIVAAVPRMLDSLVQSGPSGQVGKQPTSGTSSGQPTSEQVANQEASRVVEVQAGVQPAWSNEGDQSKELLVTLRSSQALMKEGESAMLKASANNLSGKPLSVNMVLQLGNGLIVSSANSCTGDPCTGRFNLQDGTQALMSMLVQSSGPVAQGYSVVLHYNYTDPETGNKVQGKVEGLIGSTEHGLVR